MRNRQVAAFCLGLAFGWLIEIVANDTAAILIDSSTRCTYRFPWSGQCVRVQGHRGVHY